MSLIPVYSISSCSRAHALLEFTVSGLLLLQLQWLAESCFHKYPWFGPAPVDVPELCSILQRSLARGYSLRGPRLLHRPAEFLAQGYSLGCPRLAYIHHFLKICFLGLKGWVNNSYRSCRRPRFRSQQTTWWLKTTCNSSHGDLMPSSGLWELLHTHYIHNIREKYTHAHKRLIKFLKWFFKGLFLIYILM